MKMLARFLTTALAAVATIGCDSGTSAPPAPTEPAKADAPQSQVASKKGAKALPKKKKEPGIGKAPTSATRPRSDL